MLRRTAGGGHRRRLRLHALADSLALIELVEALEEELRKESPGFHIDDEDLQDLRTVRDAVDYVQAKL